MPEVFKTAADRTFAEAVARLNATNPFLPERIVCERAALGDEFTAAGAEWNKLPPQPVSHPHHLALVARAERVLGAARAGWGSPPAKPTRAWREATALYEELAGFWLYQTYVTRFDAVVGDQLAGRTDGAKLDFFAAWRADAERWLALPGLTMLEREPLAHLFACVFQIRRAFHHVFRGLVGGSMPMARLRAAIWQSIFTHNLPRYRRGLHARMGDFATLITGPSGTGKELVARALALSRFRAYDPRRQRLDDEGAELFYPLNLSALSPTLIESELFGHRRGAFTGAVTDRAGWMEVCPATGAVFLDEIGEVEGGIQVKLLRVLQARTFQPLGGTEARPFLGKIIAATNRDLAAEMRAGRFREDFYYRLCSDLIETPSLRAQLDDAPGELAVLVAHVAERLVGADEGEEFAREALTWIEQNLGSGYSWPGNFRELEQCVRNLLVRGAYRPAHGAGGGVAGGAADWNGLLEPGELTAEEVLRRYTRHVFTLEGGNVEATARRLDLDRRTVQARLVRTEP
jgi:DNA-binding NtrC family response regulator